LAGRGSLRKTPPAFDPNDSGYSSKYLASHKDFPSTDEDNALARREAERQRRAAEKACKPGPIAISGSSQFVNVQTLFFHHLGR